MLAISLTFPAKRFHATPWGRQVNEGAVEWPPSPWRLLRALVAVWHHKFSDVPEAEVRELVEALVVPPHFTLPPASEGHTRHYMPLINGDKTKVFDTFVAVSPQDQVLAVWPDVNLTPAQESLLKALLNAMTYFGRAESWVCADTTNIPNVILNAEPYELGQTPPPEKELVRTLVPITSDQQTVWYSQMLEQHRKEKLEELIAKAVVKGKPADKVALTKKDEETIAASIPKTLFDALHVDTSDLRKNGWNQPPGSRWVNYVRPLDSFSPSPSTFRAMVTKKDAPTVARFAVCGTVRPLLTDAVLFGDRMRKLLMGCSKKVRADGNAGPVFSGKYPDGTPMSDGHLHAHYLCEAAGKDGRISHVTIYAPMGFDAEDEMAFSQLVFSRMHGKNDHDLQFVLLGIGNADDFGGLDSKDEKAGKSCLLGTSTIWESRTPFIPTRHLSKKGIPSREAVAREPKLQAELIEAVRLELRNRAQFKRMAESVEIIPLLERKNFGTHLGGHFTSWLKFRRERLQGDGVRAGSNGFGLKLNFPQPVTGPISLGYASHFGLGMFIPAKI